MKKILFFFLLLNASAMAQKDTTVVTFEDLNSKKTIKIYNKDAKGITLPKVINLKTILSALNVDSTETQKAIILISKNKNSNDTLAVINKNQMIFKIITAPTQETTYDDEIKSFETIDGKIITQPNYDLPKENQNSEIKIQTTKPRRYFSKKDFAVYLGLNSYANKENIAPNELNDLRVWPSRYVALSFRGNATLSNSKKVHIAFSYSPEIAWNNFMLQNSNVLRYENNQAIFVENDNETRKSKFVVPHLMLPVLVNIGFKEEDIHIGVGGYVGYRIGGYTKEKFNKGNDKTTGSFGLNDIKYGVTAEVGKKGSGTLFIRYDLSNLFKESQMYARDMQAFSFGIRF